MHRWISTDNGDECFSCGVVLDYTDPQDEHPESLDERDRAAHDLVGWCNGPTDARTHHFVLIAAMDSWSPNDQAFGYGLECAYGDPINPYGTRQIRATTSYISHACTGA